MREKEKMGKKDEGDETELRGHVSFARFHSRVSKPTLYLNIKFRSCRNKSLQGRRGEGERRRKARVDSRPFRAARRRRNDRRRGYN